MNDLSASTSLTECPWNVLIGRSCPSLQTWMHMSVLQEANVLLLCQSTSRAGAVGDGQQGVGEFNEIPTIPIQPIGDLLYLNGRGTAAWPLLCERPI